ncbi:MAG: IPT/TIG domain-containing protein [Ignavibacteriota bacterium]
MKKIIYKTFISLFLLSIVFINGCADEPTASLEGYPSQNLPTPILSTLEPSSQALAGITEITISGTNFSAEARNNLVYFNGVPGTILSATSTELKVKVPNVVSDTVMVKIAVVGAKDFSNQYQYKMLSAWEEYYPFNAIAEKAYGIITDDNNNLYVNLYDIGIWKITPDKQKSLFVPKGNTQKWDNFRYGPGGELYGVRSARGVWKVAENVAPAAPWAAPSAGVIVALEFDSNQNLWALNNNNTIFKIKQDKSFTNYPFTGVLRAIRIFNNDLYVSALKDNIEGVWRIPIDANGDLGTEELYFETTNIRIGAKISALAFAADGDLILGMDDGPNPLLVVKPDKSYETLYPGVIGANSVVSIFWPANEDYLFFVRGEERSADGTKVQVGQTPIRVVMQKNGSAYFGQ